MPRELFRHLGDKALAWRELSRTSKVSSDTLNLISFTRDQNVFRWEALLLFITFRSESLISVHFDLAIFPESEEKPRGIKGYAIRLQMSLKLCKPLLKVFGIEL